MYKSLFLFSAFIFLFCFCTRQEEAVSPVPVILDTDVGNDIDDVLAMQMLFNYEKAGKIDLLGITISKCNPYAVEYVDGYSRFNGKHDLPIGYAYEGMNPDDGHYLRQTLDTVLQGSKVLFPQRSLKDSIPEGHKLLRKLLAGEKDRSVVLIAIGPETNLARLLRSEADEYSPLDGKELVARKVKRLSLMGGLFGDAFDFPEWNIVNDLQAARITFEEWPTPLIASGWEVGHQLLYPHQSIRNDFPGNGKHPLCVSYGCYQEMPFDRDTWDLTSVLQAVEPEKNYFRLSEKGTITIDSLGYSLFSPSPSGQHQYLILEGKENIASALNALVRQVTGKTNEKP